MKTLPTHPWDLSPAEATRLQRELADMVIPETHLSAVHCVAGADLSTRRGSAHATAAVVVLDYPALNLRESRVVETTVTFPYVPGLLSFRETPSVLAAFAQLSVRPDLLIVDGQGLAHPRRMGFACHVGLLLDLPTIGCAKSRLVGQYVEPGPLPGDWTPLEDQGETVGVALRTKAGSKPLFVSIGHKIGLDAARDWVLRCCQGYRLPEPARLAHLAATGRLQA